ncbi:MAG: HAMP domain-containing histidine kinase [Oscillospiraceae bacterium]|nr:HAMP domain-containing histidine kinase [Oscillospiraceae bacterium]
MRVFSSLRVRIAFSYALLLAVVLVLMNTYFLTASRDMIFTSKHTLIRNQAAIMETALADFDDLSIDDVSQVMARLDVDESMRVVIMDDDGILLYDTTDSAGGSYYADFFQQNASRALGGYDVISLRFSEGVFYSSALLPVIRDGAVIGAVYVHEGDAQQGAILVGLQSTIKSISILVTALSVFIVALILWTVMRRISSILRAIKLVREGEYNYRISVGGNDELALLGEEFNSLTDRLRDTDEIRRRFVADASHELKTPLASIRLLSDSILNNDGMDPDTVREFVTDIGNESERLARTTEKLMTLTRLDNNIIAERASVDMREVATDTLHMLRPLAASRGLTIESALDGGCFVLATRDEVYMIILNLTENAIKYNTPGGSVCVKLTREAEHSILTVDDTGIGVPEADMPHIFDRFYRVDKARSREAGGSGLGLSLVRDAALGLGGSVTAENRRDGGMRFRVRLPLYIAPE